MSNRKHDVPLWAVFVLAALLVVGFVVQGVGHYMKIRWLYILGNGGLIVFSIAGIMAAFGEWWAPTDD
jgi:hypothetical protein